MIKTALMSMISLALLLSATATPVFISLAEANPIFTLPEIVIYSDGSVNPETEVINRNGNMYTLTADLTREYVIRIQCSNIVFDGAEHLINGTYAPVYGYQGPGLLVENVTNVTLKDIKVTGFSNYNIRVQGCFNCSLLRVSPDVLLFESSFNTVTEATGRLALYYSDNNLLIRNSFTGGLDLHSSSSNTVSSNNISGLTVIDSSLNLLFKNNFLESYLLEFHYKANYWDNGSVGNYWADYSTKYPNATEIAGTGVGDTPYVLDANNVDHYPLTAPVDTVAPSVLALSPENKSYETSSIPLNFIVNEPLLQIEYSLDGEKNVTIEGNTTLTGLANGGHNLTVYVWDEAGNVGASETLSFTVDVPFPTTLVAVASGVSLGAVGLGIVVYFKKRKR